MKQKESEAERLSKILKILKHTYPDAKCSLDYRTPFQLLVATILSAQCTDVRVNKVTPELFKKYPDAKAMAKAPQENLEQLVASTGFYRAKAKNIKSTAEKIMGEHRGEVPHTMEELTSLAGVGRKTANVVLGNAFGSAGGIVVDTHVKRVTFRLGLTKHTNPEKVEVDLNAKIPKKDWVNFPHWIIYHGRQICIARSPRCNICPLNTLCPKHGISKKYLTALPPQLSGAISYPI